MRNELTFDGKNFSDFSAYIASSNFLDGASQDVESVTVPGRNGDLIYDNKRYNNLSITEHIYVTKNMKVNMDSLRNYLLSKKGYFKLRESINPQQYRQAYFAGPFTPDKYDHIGGTVTLSFRAMPQRWLDSGDSWLTVKTGDTITNPTLQDAKPIVRISGTGDVQIGSGTITISKAGTSYIDVDTDILVAYEGDTNRGSSVSITGDILLKANGSTGITFGSNIKSVKILPRWFEI